MQRMSRPILNCDEPDWEVRLRDYLIERKEVDLINFDAQTHGCYCSNLARNFAMELRHKENRSFDTAHFRKISSG